MICDRCENDVSEELTKVKFDGMERKICSECVSRLYHWMKMECHCYGCDEE